MPQEIKQTRTHVHLKRPKEPTVLNYDTESFQIAVASSDQSQVILLML